VGLDGNLLPLRIQVVTPDDMPSPAMPTDFTRRANGTLSESENAVTVSHSRTCNALMTCSINAWPTCWCLGSLRYENPQCRLKPFFAQEIADDRLGQELQRLDDGQNQCSDPG
jgi:hypothetical protein